MRLSTLVPTLLLLSSTAIRAQDAPPSSIDAVVFLEADQDVAAVQARLTDLLQRTSAKVQGEAGTPAHPLVETARTTTSARYGVTAIDFRVTLPPDVTREAFLLALAEDETCTASNQSCGESCRRLATVAKGGHWHYLPDPGGHQCLVAFMADEAAALQAEKVVLRRPRRFGVGETPSQKVQVVIGRPDFPEEIDKQP